MLVGMALWSGYGSKGGDGTVRSAWNNLSRGA